MTPAQSPLREQLVFAKSDTLLRDDVRRLGAMVGQMLAEQVSPVFLQQVDTLRRAAAAMDCELVVLVVPRQSLQSSVDQQRLKLYNATFKRAAVHMKLEDQAVSDDLHRHLLQQAEAAIPDTALWREHG